MQTVLSIAIDALAYGMALFIICIGLSLTMGLMRVVNLAHGAFAMIARLHRLLRGARSRHRLCGRHLAGDRRHGHHLHPAGAAAVPPHLRQRRELTQVLMTIGITFCVIGITNYFFGPTLKTIPLPGSLRQPVDLGFRPIAAHRLFVMACGVGRGRRPLVPDREDGFRHQAAGDRRQRGHGRCARRAHAGGLCGQLRHRHRACGVRRRGRRRVPADRALLCAALHGDLPRRRLGRRRGLDSRRARSPACCSARSTRPAAT